MCLPGRGSVSPEFMSVGSGFFYRPVRGYENSPGSSLCGLRFSVYGCFCARNLCPRCFCMLASGVWVANSESLIRSNRALVLTEGVCWMRLAEYVPCPDPGRVVPGQGADFDRGCLTHAALSDA